MIEIPIFNDIVTQINKWIFTDQSVMIIVTVFVVVIGLALLGASRVEEN